MTPRNNEEYLREAFKQLEAAGINSPHTLKRINDEFQASRETLRQTMGSTYDQRISEYKQMLHELMHKFKVGALLAARHAIEQLQKPEHKDTDPLGIAQMMFMAAALDILEPQIRNN